MEKDKTLSKEKVAAAIARAPAIASVLKKLAAKVARGLRLPGTFSVRGLDYDAQGELERLFGTMGQRQSDGRFVVPLLPIFKETAEWNDVLAYFGYSVKRKTHEDVFGRLKLLLPPSLEPVSDILASKDDIVRFAQKPENSRDWLTLATGFIGRMAEGAGQITTLSQLGADWFGDSKKLRTGPWRRQLVQIITAISEYDPDDERLVLEGALVLDNPYTSHVTFSAPVVLYLEDGEVYDYPARYHASCRAVQLPLETVLAIDRIEWKGTSKTIATSENAAPFATMVESQRPCVYTAGYPNLAVKILLRKLADCGRDCEHAGDADLDGFRIASEVAACIPLSRVVAADVLRTAGDDVGLPLASDQAQRMWAHLSKPQWENFKYNDEIRMLLRRGRWIEQESFERIVNED